VSATVAAAGRPAGIAYRALTLRRRLILLAMFGLLLASLVVDLMLGPARYDAGQVLRTLMNPSEAPAALRVVIWDIRLPVALMAVVTGAALAMAGAQMQTILNNPLASPFTLGISAAASFGAALALVFGVALVPFAIDYIVPINAFIMAMITL
jgi:iron complex transport system permease protein